MGDRTPRLAILYPGDRAARDRSDPTASRFAALFSAFATAGVSAEPAIYHDDFCDEVEAQLARVRGVLVWHNPIEGGRPRHRLDAMLERVADRGVFVSTHPAVVRRMGTKDVLVDLRDLPFGSDCHRIDHLDRLRDELPRRLAAGARVLKQHRGHSGIGVWRVEAIDDETVRLRHAQRGSVEERVPWRIFIETMAPYFKEGGHMIDQPWQPRLREGMIRAYLVRDRVAGFGHQEVNALYPAQGGERAPEPGPRLYCGPDDPRFASLRRRLEGEWVEMIRTSLGLAPRQLPLLWDADFLLGERHDGESDEDERYVLCEINVSSVAPFPDSAIPVLVKATRGELT